MALDKKKCEYSEAYEEVVQRMQVRVPLAAPIPLATSTGSSSTAASI